MQSLLTPSQLIINPNNLLLPNKYHILRLAHNKITFSKFNTPPTVPPNILSFPNNDPVDNTVDNVNRRLASRISTV